MVYNSCDTEAVNFCASGKKQRVVPAVQDVLRYILHDYFLSYMLDLEKHFHINL
jgi:hypothetical protein